MLHDLKTQLGSSLRKVRDLLERPIGAGPDHARSRGPSHEADRKRERHEQRLRVRRMRRDLYELMQRHQGARLLMAHLDVVERTLGEQGLAGVEKLPVRLIAKALAQLERLVWDWSPVGLAELRSRMAMMVKERRDEVAAAKAEAAPETDFEASIPQADLVEVDHAIFEEMERSWAGQLPAGAAAALAQAKSIA